VRAVLAALEEQQLLQTFCTTLAVQPEDWPLKMLPARLRHQVARRGYTFPRGTVVRFPAREAVRHIASALHISALTTHETGWASVDAVCRGLDHAVAHRLRVQNPSPRLSGVYCYEDCAWQTFQAAKEQGLACFYDLPIAYWETAQRLLEEEAARWPEWEPTLVGTRDSPAKLARKTEELALADVVLAPSRFVLDSLPAQARAQKPCYVTEFGSPSVPAAESDAGVSTLASESGSEQQRRLRVLFVGSMTQRKGLADLFAAMKLLNRADVELVVMGSPVAPLEFYRRQYSGFRYEALRPHADVLRLMRSCDVLALPSLVEGRALVQQEALACGLPLLVTANAGGEDLIDEGRTGFLVPIRSPEIIAENIAWFADNRALLPDLRQCAQAKAAQYTWGRYGDRIAEIVCRHSVHKVA